MSVALLGTRSAIRFVRRWTSAVLLAVAPAALLAQAAPPRDSAAGAARDSGRATDPRPPIRRIATASALSTEPLGSITSVRELPGGRVLVNDGARRRLLLMDSTLRTLGVVLDSLAEIENTYGTRPGALIPYLADSTLFIDPVSFAMLVIDPSGRVAQVRSVPRVEDASRFGGGEFGARSGVDARGRLVYRRPARPARPTVRPPRGVPYFPQQPDSAFIVAIDIETRKIDTLGAIRIPRTRMTVRRLASGGFDFDEMINPLPSTDEWAVLPDGVVAFVRGIDYRVEYRHPDGTWTSTPKLPYDWQRLTDDDKQRMIDSVTADQRRSAMNQYVSAMIRWVNTYGKSYPPDFTVPEGYRVQNGLSRDWKLPPGLQFPANYTYACRPGETPTVTPAPAEPNERTGERAAERRPGPPGERGGGPPGGPQGTPSCIPQPVRVSGGNAPAPPRLRVTEVMEPADLPSYRPPFSSGAVRADADGNLWIRTIQPKPIPGGAVFDIVSREGVVVDRLQVPPGYTVVGFGKGRVVYLSRRDQGGIRLARVQLR